MYGYFKYSPRFFFVIFTGVFGKNFADISNFFFRLKYHP